MVMNLTYKIIVKKKNRSAIATIYYQLRDDGYTGNYYSVLRTILVRSRCIRINDACSHKKWLANLKIC